MLSPGEKATADVPLRAVPSLHLRIHTGGSGDNPVLGRMVFPRVSQRIFDGFLDSVTHAPVSWIAPGVIEISGLAPGHYVIEMPLPSGLAEKPNGEGWYREIDLVGDAEVNASDGPRFAAVGGSVIFDNVTRVPAEAAIQLSNPETGESFRSDISGKGEFDFQGDDVRPGRYMVALDNANGFFLQQVTATGAIVKGRTIDISGRTESALPQSLPAEQRGWKALRCTMANLFPELWLCWCRKIRETTCRYFAATKAIATALLPCPTSCPEPIP